MTSSVDTIATVINAYGDPAAFAERELELSDSLQKLDIGTQLVDLKHVIELQAKVDALYELAAQANQNCQVVSGYFKHHRPGLAGVCLNWCENIEAELKEVMGED